MEAGMNVIASQTILTDFASPGFSAGHQQFTAAESEHAYQVQGETIVLRHHPDVFPPSAFGLKLAAQIDFTGCRRAIDIGTGTGLLAILAARKGVAEVLATDISDLSVRLADYNAREMNGVAVEARQGSFFAGFEGPFDVIIANLPQEILPPAYKQTLSAEQRRAIEGGGPGGNGILLDFLAEAPAFMNEQTKLHVFVDTVTDYRAALALIDRLYTSRLLWEGLTATKTFVRDNPEFFGALNDAGIVSLVQDEAGNWLARQLIYQLSLRRDAESPAR
jgi:release factor glutamine methyltransferase